MVSPQAHGAPLAVQICSCSGESMPSTHPLQRGCRRSPPESLGVCNASNASHSLIASVARDSPIPDSASPSECGAFTSKSVARNETPHRRELAKNGPMRPYTTDEIIATEQ
jgi:hypothetical protein